jgi:hypothetical protein
LLYIAIAAVAREPTQRQHEYYVGILKIDNYDSKRYRKTAQKGMMKGR